MADYTNYTPEQLQKIYQELPEELRDALFSRDTAEIIFDICERNIVLEKVSQISEYVGHVLLGLLPPVEFQKALEEKVVLRPDAAEKLAKDISRLIFLPLKSSLEIIYGPLEVGEAEILEKKESPSTVPAPETTSIETPRKDVYREPLE